MRRLSRPLAICALLVVVATGSYQAGVNRAAATGASQASALAKVSAPPSEGTPPGDARKRFETFWEAWNFVESEFYNREAIDYQEMTHGAIRGMLETLGDTHTTFIDPNHTLMSEEQMRGAFDGVGVSVELRNKRVTVTAPLDDSPAAKAGLRTGDAIVAVDGRDITTLALTEAITLIRGPRGTVVRLTVERPGVVAPLVFEIVRAEIKTVTVRAQMMGDIGYVKINQFAGPTALSLQQKLKGLLEANPTGIVLDLRNNPGGLLTSAIEVASQFIGDGVVMHEQRRDAPMQDYHAKPGGLATNLPVAVLINKGSASASEIVAGALQDRGRGALIGEASFGKDTVQNMHQLGDHSSVRVTIARWYTPNKQEIARSGLKPDIDVPITDDDAKALRDPQLERAMEKLRGTS